MLGFFCVYKVYSYGQFKNLLDRSNEVIIYWIKKNFRVGYGDGNVEYVVLKLFFRLYFLIKIFIIYVFEKSQ